MGRCQKLSICLDGGEIQTINLDFITDRYMPVGLQKILLSIDYKLPDGTPKHQDEVIEIPVKVGDVRRFYTNELIDEANQFEQEKIRALARAWRP